MLQVKFCLPPLATLAYAPKYTLTLQPSQLIFPAPLMHASSPSAIGRVPVFRAPPEEGDPTSHAADSCSLNHLRRRARTLPRKEAGTRSYIRAYGEQVQDALGIILIIC